MRTARKLSLWTCSLLLVVSVHAGAGLWSLLWRAKPPIELPPDPPLMVQLEPLPPPPTPTPVLPEPLPEPDPAPKLAEAQAPALAVAPPPPKPRHRPPEPPKKHREHARPLERHRQEPPAEPRPDTVARSAATAPASTATHAVNTPAAPEQLDGAVTARKHLKASWQSRLQSHLARHQHYPDAAKRRERPGVKVNRVRFTIDARGQVLAYELVGQSGNPHLDRATLEMVRRAQPLPPPPAELLDNGTLEIEAPIAYELKPR